MLGLALALPYRQFFGGSDGGAGNLNPIPGLSPVAYYKFNTGLTSSAGLVSQWNDQIGGHHLVQATGARKPSVDGAGILTFDGVDDFLKASAFTFNQPATVAILLKQITWTANEVISCGDVDAVFDIVQDKTGGSGSSPSITQYSGAYGGNDLTHATLGVFHSIFSVFNGASSLIRVDNNSNNTGDAGAGNGAGFTLADTGTGGSHGIANANIAVKEVALFPVALSAANMDAIYAYWLTL